MFSDGALLHRLSPDVEAPEAAPHPTKQQKWVKLFQIAYLTGTVCWGYVHAMFTNMALIFKFTFEKYGDMQTAAEIANKVFYCNARAAAGIVYSLRCSAFRRDDRYDLEKDAFSEKHSTSDTRIFLQPHRFYGNRGEISSRFCRGR